MKKFINSSILQNVLIAIVLILPLVICISTIISGNIDFGYDHARDFLSALDNLNKLTFIGPTSGIPGVFYGPYWIWLISLGLLFSHDPAVVVFIILTIPYFTILPLVLFKFRKIFGLLTCTILWILFIFSTGIKYATSPWNPHPAPLLFVILIYLITFTNFSEKGYSKYLKIVLIGIISGLILNFHISFGIGVAFGVLTFFIVDFIRHAKKQKNKWGYLLKINAVRIACFSTGVFLAFLPFFTFEARHGFMQIRTAAKVITSKGSVVSVVGMEKTVILKTFFGTIAELLKLPTFLALVLFIGSAIYFIYRIKTKIIKLDEEESKLLLLLLSVMFGILFLYLTSKNPVWSYHFIGVEIIFLFLLGLIASKEKIVRNILLIWIVLVFIVNSRGIINYFHQNPYVNSSSLATEKNIVKTIINDASSSNYNVFAYSASIYSYEYSYLFKWLDNRDFPYDPGQNRVNSELIYLIIPQADEKVKADFINYRTPNISFKTVKQWEFQDGTLVLKRTHKTANNY